MMDTTEKVFVVFVLLLVLGVGALVAIGVACGPTSVQIKQEVWQCEARHEGANGSVTFEGCKRDGQDSQGSGQEGGPTVEVKDEPVSLAPPAWKARLN